MKPIVFTRHSRDRLAKGHPCGRRLTGIQATDWSAYPNPSDWPSQA